jgi:hypothetical protein
MAYRHADRPYAQGELLWFKSSYSGGSGTECVEAAISIELTVVRDSKCPEGPTLSFSRDAWSTFVTAVQLTDPRQPRET